MKFPWRSRAALGLAAASAAIVVPLTATSASAANVAPLTATSASAANVLSQDTPAHPNTPPFPWQAVGAGEYGNGYWGCISEEMTSMHAYNARLGYVQYDNVECVNHPEEGPNYYEAFWHRVAW